jgi:hypothetical protein
MVFTGFSEEKTLYLSAITLTIYVAAFICRD